MQNKAHVARGTNKRYAAVSLAHAPVGPQGRQAKHGLNAPSRPSDERTAMAGDATPSLVDRPTAF